MLHWRVESAYLNKPFIFLNKMCRSGCLVFNRRAQLKIFHKILVRDQLFP